MQKNSRRTAFGRKGHDDCRSRITFHATSYHGYGNGALETQISSTYGTFTPMRQASQPSEPNRQTTLRCRSGRRFCFCICAPKSQILSNPPQLSWCCLDRLVNPFVNDLPRGQLPTWVPLYMCGLEQVARSATRRCLGGDPMRCRSIDARDARRRCPPAEARTRAAANS